MLNLGFRTQLTAILAMMPKKRQNILFSATTDEDAILNDYFDYPQEVTLSASGTYWKTSNKSLTMQLISILK
jgi:ATP-dependent RNA helicase RhlE